MLEPHGVLWLCQGSGTLEDPPVLPVGSGFGMGLQKERGQRMPPAWVGVPCAMAGWHSAPGEV